MLPRRQQRTRRRSDREPADSLTEEKNVIGGWLPSLTFHLRRITRIKHYVSRGNYRLGWRSDYLVLQRKPEVRTYHEIPGNTPRIIYLDRLDTQVQQIALGIVDFPDGEKRVFEFEDAAGQKRRVPFHRIREVYRDGALIWRRPIALSQ